MVFVILAFVFLMNTFAGIVTRSDDVVNRRGDDTAPIGEDFHSKANTDPADLQEAAAHAGAAEPCFGERGKEVTAFDQNFVAG